MPDVLELNRVHHRALLNLLPLLSRVKPGDIITPAYLAQRGVSGESSRHAMRRLVGVGIVEPIGKSGREKAFRRTQLQWIEVPWLSEADKRLDAPERVRLVPKKIVTPKPKIDCLLTQAWGPKDLPAWPIASSRYVLGVSMQGGE